MTVTGEFEGDLYGELTWTVTFVKLRVAVELKGRFLLGYADWPEGHC